MVKRHKSMPNRRLRVSDQIQKDIAEIITFELKEPNLGIVTITEVDVTPDYSSAKVFFTILNDDEEAIHTVTQKLNKASGFIRNQLGRRIKIHTMPQLRFEYDHSIAHGMALTQLIEKANATRSQDA